MADHSVCSFIVFVATVMLTKLLARATAFASFLLLGFMEIGREMCVGDNFPHRVPLLIDIVARR